MKKYKPRKCEKCGNVFKPNSPVTKWCIKCHTFTCRYCGKEFMLNESSIATGERGKYCSRKCYLSDRWGEKTCPICKVRKPSTGRRYCSKKCATQANKESCIRSRDKKIQYYKDQKTKLFDYLGNKCQLCGYDNIAALDIHHPNGKEKNWKRNQNRWIRYWKERKSIQLVCANCHRIIHHSPQET